jgi:two-component system, chemotaxis family, chemotaxis protein CheY
MKSCLIVDDSRVQRSFTRAVVENLKFDCREALDARSAVLACGFSMPDVILLGWNMAGSSGLDCLKAIRTMPKGGNPKIVLCSANGEIEDILLALEEGADEYLMRPFDQDIMRSKFEQIGVM